MLELKLDDNLVMKKKHPCGSFQWRIFRLGADIGISCAGCGRKVLMPRAKLETRIKKVISPSVDPTT